MTPKITITQCSKLITASTIGQMDHLKSSSSSSVTARWPQCSRKRPRCTFMTSKTCFINSTGLLLLALLRCGSGSQAGGGQGEPYRYSTPSRRQMEVDTFEVREQLEVTYVPQSGSNPRQFVQRQHPLAGIRRLAVAMEEEDRAEVARYVAMVLQKLANMNELFMGERNPCSPEKLVRINKRARKGTVFHSASMPSVSVAEFVERVANNLECPNLCLMLSLIYMDRLALPSSELHLYVTPLTVHRLFAASLIIAIKFIGVTPESTEGDRLYEKMHSVTGLAESELKHLEHHMLQALAKNAFISEAETKRYLVNFAPKADELVAYVDSPYMGPPPFPFQ